MVEGEPFRGQKHSGAGVASGTELRAEWTQIALCIRLGSEVLTPLDHLPLLPLW